MSDVLFLKSEVVNPHAFIPISQWVYLQVKECQCSGLQVIDYRSKFCYVEHSQARTGSGPK